MNGKKTVEEDMDYRLLYSCTRVVFTASSCCRCGCTWRNALTNVETCALLLFSAPRGRLPCFRGRVGGGPLVLRPFPRRPSASSRVVYRAYDLPSQLQGSQVLPTGEAAGDREAGSWWRPGSTRRPGSKGKRRPAGRKRIPGTNE